MSFEVSPPHLANRPMFNTTPCSEISGVQVDHPERGTCDRWHLSFSSGCMSSSLPSFLPWRCGRVLYCSTTPHPTKLRGGVRPYRLLPSTPSMGGRSPLHFLTIVSMNPAWYDANSTPAAFIGPTLLMLLPTPLTCTHKTQSLAHPLRQECCPRPMHLLTSTSIPRCAMPSLEPSSSPVPRNHASPSASGGTMSLSASGGLDHQTNQTKPILVCDNLTKVNST